LRSTLATRTSFSFIAACREHRLFSDFAVKLPLFAQRLDREPAAPTCPI
jgi:hypothetical protein